MDYKINLVLQEPIVFESIKIYQPTLLNILEYGIEEYNQLLLPYSLTFDLLNIPEDKIEGLKYFDIVCADEVLFGLLIKSLQYFCKTDNISSYKNNLVIEKCLLNRDNFDEFSKIILDINAREKPKNDKPPKFESDRQREVWLKLQEGRKRTAKESEMQLCDVLNIVEYGGKYRIPIDDIKHMTLWKIMNAYKAKLSISNYEDSFQIYLVSGEKKLVKDHWTQQIKVS